MHMGDIKNLVSHISLIINKSCPGPGADSPLPTLRRHRQLRHNKL